MLTLNNYSLQFTVQTIKHPAFLSYASAFMRLVSLAMIIPSVMVDLLFLIPVFTLAGASFAVDYLYKKCSYTVVYSAKSGYFEVKKVFFDEKEKMEYTIQYEEIKDLSKPEETTDGYYSVLISTDRGEIVTIRADEYMYAILDVRRKPI